MVQLGNQEKVHSKCWLALLLVLEKTQYISFWLKVDSHHYSHDQQPRRPRKGRGQLRRDKERAAKHRAGAALDQNAKTTSDNINETTAAVDSNDGNIEKDTNDAAESGNSNGAVPNEQVETNETTKDIPEPVVKNAALRWTLYKLLVI